jgi:hypothetical protein
VRGRSDGQQKSGGPAEQQRNRMSEERSDPAEVSLYVAVAVELGVSLGEERTGEEDSEEKKDDSANLAGQRRAGGPIAPVRARAW